MTIFLYKVDQKSDIPSEFFPISGDWGKLGIPNCAGMSLVKCCRILQNERSMFLKDKKYTQNQLHIS